MHVRAQKSQARRFVALIAVAAATVASVLASVPPAAAGTTVYSVTQTIPVPPASNYAGVGGGDGWDVSFTNTAVYNVFHHAGSMTMACHLQSDASQCHPSRTVTDAGGHNFATQAHSGTYVDAAAQKLYAFGTRDDSTGGVVCIDLALAVSSTNPFCGFTELDRGGPGAGLRALDDRRPGPCREPNVRVQLRQRRGGPEHPEQADVLRPLDEGGVCIATLHRQLRNSVVNVTNYPAPTAARIGDKIIVTADGSNGPQLSCFDTGTNATCAGSWPVAAPASYVSVNGAPFPSCRRSERSQAFCLPTGADPCYDLAGASIATPPGMPAAITATYGWNGGAFVLGPRVYLPDGINNTVLCYNASTDASCVHFPKTIVGAGLVYSVNPDPARPTCIWINADNGSAQIQNFDAFSGQACGQGADPGPRGELRRGRRAVPAGVVHLAGDPDAPAECLHRRHGGLPGRRRPADPGHTGQVARRERRDRPVGAEPVHGAGLPQFVVNLNGLPALRVRSCQAHVDRHRRPGVRPERRPERRTPGRRLRARSARP